MVIVYVKKYTNLCEKSNKSLDDNIMCMQTTIGTEPDDSINYR